MDNKNLIDKILKASDIIHKSSIKGYGDYVVSSPSVAQMIQDVYNEQRSNYRKEKIIRIFDEKD